MGWQKCSGIKRSYLGINKYHLLNLPYDAPEKPLDAPELLDFAQQYACQKGLTATLRG